MATTTTTHFRSHAAALLSLAAVLSESTTIVAPSAPIPRPARAASASASASPVRPTVPMLRLLAST